MQASVPNKTTFKINETRASAVPKQPTSKSRHRSGGITAQCSSQNSSESMLVVDESILGSSGGHLEDYGHQQLALSAHADGSGGEGLKRDARSANLKIESNSGLDSAATRMSTQLPKVGSLSSVGHHDPPRSAQLQVKRARARLLQLRPPSRLHMRLASSSSNRRPIAKGRATLGVSSTRRSE